MIVHSDRVGTFVAEAGPLLGEGDQPGSKFLLNIGHDWLSPLGRAVLADVSAGPAFGDREVLDQVFDRLAPPGRTQNFPLATSSSARMFSSLSATSLLSCWFSLRSSLSSLASSAFMPPYWFRQR